MAVRSRPRNQTRCGIPPNVMSSIDATLRGSRWPDASLNGGVKPHRGQREEQTDRQLPGALHAVAPARGARRRPPYLANTTRLDITGSLRDGRRRSSFAKEDTLSESCHSFANAVRGRGFA